MRCAVLLRLNDAFLDKTMRCYLAENNNVYLLLHFHNFTTFPSSRIITFWPLFFKNRRFHVHFKYKWWRTSIEAFSRKRKNTEICLEVVIQSLSLSIKQMEKNTREIHCHKYDLRERERKILIRKAKNNMVYNQKACK